MAPFEGPFVFGPLMTSESKVEPHRLSIFLTAIQMGLHFSSSRDLQRPLDMLLIPLILAKFTSWQDMLSHYPESFTSAFCAEVPEVKSVN